MPAKKQSPLPKRRTPSELRKLPVAERDRLLEEQAALAEQEYRTNRELTAFEAFDEENLRD
jgi:hypothetical protein